MKNRMYSKRRCDISLALESDDVIAPVRPRQRAGSRSMVQSVLNALDILDYLASCGGEASVTEVAQFLDVHKSTASRLLATLNSRGYVMRNKQTKQYSLGMRLVELSRAKLDQLDLREFARPYLEELVAATGETAHLAILDHSQVIYIDKVDTPQTLMMRSKIGYRIAAHCTALGKAIMAELPDETVDSILGSMDLVRFTANTVADPEHLKLHLASVRERGYAVDDEEHEEGIRCVAAAVKDYAGRVVAAISVSGPTMRVSRKRVDEIGRIVRDAASRLSASLGHSSKIQSP